MPILVSKDRKYCRIKLVKCIWISILLNVLSRPLSELEEEEKKKNSSSSSFSSSNAIERGWEEDKDSAVFEGFQIEFIIRYFRDITKIRISFELECHRTILQPIYPSNCRKRRIYPFVVNQEKYWLGILILHLEASILFWLVNKMKSPPSLQTQSIINTHYYSSPTPTQRKNQNQIRFAI